MNPFGRISSFLQKYLIRYKRYNVVIITRKNDGGFARVHANTNLRSASGSSGNRFAFSFSS